ncbi:hypothetical protein FA95DRAFT_122609 [Auriscalpium vulgare]|uniref:Uncharacterized protein n=1 Tax=Auriscalpium vulgare TaxID=40419 RepID=A0ACB8R0K0_9AGAM|nr:hypothetical protein FA95DRAFT_122609 [Auriscalpium vulgare]
MHAMMDAGLPSVLPRPQCVDFCRTMSTCRESQLCGNSDHLVACCPIHARSASHSRRAQETPASGGEREQAPSDCTTVRSAIRGSGYTRAAFLIEDHGGRFLRVSMEPHQARRGPSWLVGVSEDVQRFRCKTQDARRKR